MPRAATAVLDSAHALGITLRAEADAIRFRPSDAMSPELAAAIRQHRAEVLELLAAAVPPPRAPCWTCRGTKFLARPTRLTWICARCHPPSTGIVWHHVEINDTSASPQRRSGP